LAITAEYFRLILACQGRYSTKVDETIPVFTCPFKADGVPFTTNTLGRLSLMSAWGVKLGVIPILIQPGSPQQSGKHERMHKTLKDEATKPPAVIAAHDNESSNTTPKSLITSDRTRHSTAIHPLADINLRPQRLSPIEDAFRRIKRSNN